MAEPGIGEFVKEVDSNVDLQNEVLEKLNAAAEDEIAAATVDVGARHGFRFTVEEAEDFHRALNTLRQQQAGGELTDDELEGVAGGAPMFYVDYATLLGATSSSSKGSSKKGGSKGSGAWWLDARLVSPLPSSSDDSSSDEESSDDDSSSSHQDLSDQEGTSFSGGSNAFS